MGRLWGLVVDASQVQGQRCLSSCARRGSRHWGGGGIWVSKIGTPVAAHSLLFWVSLLKETVGKKGTCSITGFLENLVKEFL